MERLPSLLFPSSIFIHVLLPFVDTVTLMDEGRRVSRAVRLAVHSVVTRRIATDCARCSEDEAWLQWDEVNMVGILQRKERGMLYTIRWVSHSWEGGATAAKTGRWHMRMYPFYGSKMWIRERITGRQEGCTGCSLASHCWWRGAYFAWVVLKKDLFNH